MSNSWHTIFWSTGAWYAGSACLPHPLMMWTYSCTHPCKHLEIYVYGQIRWCTDDVPVLFAEWVIENIDLRAGRGHASTLRGEELRPQMLCECWWGAEPITALLLSQSRVMFRMLSTSWLFRFLSTHRCLLISHCQRKPLLSLLISLLVDSFVCWNFISGQSNFIISVCVIPRFLNANP